MKGSDRKSTRLNSSHLVISYAVFCLKKKKQRRYARSSRLRRVCSAAPHTRTWPLAPGPSPRPLVSTPARRSPPPPRRPPPPGRASRPTPSATLRQSQTAPQRDWDTRLRKTRRQTEGHAARVALDNGDRLCWSLFLAERLPQLVFFFFLNDPPPPEIPPLPQHAPLPT